MEDAIYNRKIGAARGLLRFVDEDTAEEAADRLQTVIILLSDARERALTLTDRPYAGNHPSTHYGPATDLAGW